MPTQFFLCWRVSHPHWRVRYSCTENVTLTPRCIFFPLCFTGWSGVGGLGDGHQHDTLEGLESSWSFPLGTARKTSMSNYEGLSALHVTLEQRGLFCKPSLRGLMHFKTICILSTKCLGPHSAPPWKPSTVRSANNFLWLYCETSTPPSQAELLHLTKLLRRLSPQKEKKTLISDSSKEQTSLSVGRRGNYLAFDFQF